MKRIILLVLALTLVLSFVACGEKKDETPNTPDTENTDNGENKPEEKTWGDASCKDIVNTVISQVTLEFFPTFDTITPEFNPIQGLWNDGETGEGGIDFADGAVYMPMMSAQRFDMAVLRVKEGTDINAYIKDLETRNANEQWICATPPDYVKVVALGDVVLYLSINSELGDGDAIVNAFLNPIPVVKVEDEIIEDETVDGETVDGETVDGEEIA